MILLCNKGGQDLNLIAIQYGIRNCFAHVLSYHLSQRFGFSRFSSGDAERIAHIGQLVVIGRVA